LGSLRGFIHGGLFDKKNCIFNSLRINFLSN
jgi:hypothetical protein